MEVEGSLPEASMVVKCGEFTLLLLGIFFTVTYLLALQAISIGCQNLSSTNECSFSLVPRYF
jgi:hypothetical protein